MGNGKSKGRSPSGNVPQLGSDITTPSWERLKSKSVSEDPVQLPEIRMLSAREVLDSFRALARNWDAELELLFAVPPRLFSYDTPVARVYSSEEGRSVVDTVNGLQLSKLYLPGADYGIVLEQSSSTIHLTLVDAKRRIVVRKAILSFQNTPPEGDWGVFKDALKKALLAAGGEEPKRHGQFAVYADSLRFMVPESAPNLNPGASSKPGANKGK